MIWWELIGRYGLYLDWNGALLNRGITPEAPDLKLIERHRGAITTALKELWADTKIVKFYPAPRDSQRITLENHIRPALQRMQDAEHWVRIRETCKDRPRLGTRPDGGLCVVDQLGRPLDHPIGLLPELLWHLRRMYPANTAGLGWAHNQPYQRSGGGVA